MKTRKLLSLVLALVMVLSVVSFAGAATFPDVDAAQDGAVTRLVGLGILNGYPDGTFKPDKSITRAEFAKVAVLTMNLEATANMLKDVPSRFTDVPVGQWYTGYVNVATNLGILNGYPDGTFKPNNNITQAEALTIVLRLLGYNDNLPGDWPFDYVVQANLLNLVTGDFSASIPATRGTVATLVANALTKNMVSYDKDTGLFSDVSPAKTLSNRYFGGEVYLAIADVDAVTINTTSTGYHTMNVDVNGTPATGIKVAKDVKVSGGVFADSLVNHKIIYTTRAIGADEVVVAIEVLSTSVSGTVSKVSGNNVTINGTVVDYSDITGSIPAVDADVTAYIYNGKAYLSVPITVNTGTVTAKRTVSHQGASGTVITNYIKIGVTEYTVPADAVLTRNGAAATFADIQVNDSVTFTEDTGNIVTLSAWNVTITGRIDSWTKKADGKYATITVNGVVYTVATGVTIGAANEDLPIGVTATFSLDAQDRITALISTGDSATTVTGVLAGTSIGPVSTPPYFAYFVTLTNGNSYDVTAAVNAGTLRKNNKSVGITFANLYSANAAVKISYNAYGAVVGVDVYEPNAKLLLADVDIVETTLQAGTTFTHNGLPITSFKNDAEQYRITWDGVTGKALAIASADFDATDEVVIGKGTETSTGVVNYIVIEDGADGTRVDLAANAMVIKDGVVSTFDAIAIGDEVSYAVNGSGDITYIEAFTPTN